MRPLRRKHEVVANATSELGRDGCRRSCGWRESPPLKAPMRSSANTTLRSSTTTSKSQPPRKRLLFEAPPGPTWSGFFAVQTERVVAQGNTVAIVDRHWQLEKSRFRSSLAGCTVTIHEHLDGSVSIRYGPHVVGRFTAHGESRHATAKKLPESRGK